MIYFLGTHVMKKENIFFIATIFIVLSPQQVTAKSEMLLGLSFGAGTASALHACISQVDDPAVFSLGCSALAQSFWLAYQLPSMFRLRNDVDAQTSAIKRYFGQIRVDTIINGVIAGSLAPVAYKAQVDPDSLTAGDYVPVALALGAKGAHCLVGYVINRIRNDMLEK